MKAKVLELKQYALASMTQLFCEQALTLTCDPNAARALSAIAMPEAARERKSGTPTTSNSSTILQQGKLSSYPLFPGLLSSRVDLRLVEDLLVHGHLAATLAQYRENANERVDAIVLQVRTKW
jgi:hypothetical protein